LKPTPAKSHYTFNLRDISKIIGGVCSADAKTTTDVTQFLRIWVHENQRVFGDRMINDDDRNTLLDLAVAECEKLKVTRS
jgi:dynein heavy chain